MPVKQSSLIIGRQPLVEALQSGKAIDKILLQKNASGDVIGAIGISGGTVPQDFDVAQAAVAAFTP